MAEKTCTKCQRPFDPMRDNISPDSPMCEDCLLTELEKYPIMPKGVRRGRK